MVLLDERTVGSNLLERLLNGYLESSFVGVLVGFVAGVAVGDFDMDQLYMTWNYWLIAYVIYTQ